MQNEFLLASSLGELMLVKAKSLVAVEVLLFILAVVAIYLVVRVSKLNSKVETLEKVLKDHNLIDIEVKAPEKVEPDEKVVEDKPADVKLEVKKETEKVEPKKTKVAKKQVTSDKKPASKAAPKKTTKKTTKTTAKTKAKAKETK